MPKKNGWRRAEKATAQAKGSGGRFRVTPVAPPAHLKQVSLPSMEGWFSDSSSGDECDGDGDVDEPGDANVTKDDVESLVERCMERTRKHTL